jgi:hypothetical protein
MKQSTKRYIFLFCWWLGLVVIWDVFIFSGHGRPVDFFVVRNMVWLF